MVRTTQMPAQVHTQRATKPRWKQLQHAFSEETSDSLRVGQEEEWTRVEEISGPATSSTSSWRQPRVASCPVMCTILSYRNTIMQIKVRYISTELPLASTYRRRLNHSYPWGPQIIDHPEKYLSDFLASSNNPRDVQWRFLSARIIVNVKNNSCWLVASWTTSLDTVWACEERREGAAINSILSQIWVSYILYKWVTDKHIN